MTAVIHKISVGAEGKHTLLPEESLSRSVSFGKVPVRYRPNAASGGWSYGRDLVHCSAAHI